MAIVDEAKTSPVQSAIDFLRTPVSRKTELAFYACALFITLILPLMGRSA